MRIDTGSIGMSVSFFRIHKDTSNKDYYHAFLHILLNGQFESMRELGAENVRKS
jgi:hypothetical protein